MVNDAHFNNDQSLFSNCLEAVEFSAGIQQWINDAFVVYKAVKRFESGQQQSKEQQVTPSPNFQHITDFLNMLRLPPKGSSPSKAPKDGGNYDK